VDADISFTFIVADHTSLWAFSRNLFDPNLDSVVDGLDEVLLRPEVALGGLNRSMTDKG
jgi:hypothetical protein